MVVSYTCNSRNLLFFQDILFGLLKKLFQEKSPNRKEHLKVVVMSATMELAKLSAFFGNCPIFDIPGRLYPVREKFCNLIGPRDRENTAYIQAVIWHPSFLCLVYTYESSWVNSLIIHLLSDILMATLIGSKAFENQI